MQYKTENQVFPEVQSNILFAPKLNPLCMQEQIEEIDLNTGEAHTYEGMQCQDIYFDDLEDFEYQDDILNPFKRNHKQLIYGDMRSHGQIGQTLNNFTRRPRKVVHT